MKESLLLNTAAILLTVLLTPLAPGRLLEGEVWSIGYAEAEITPAPRQVQMSGFGQERYADGTLAPLLTQAVVVRDQAGGTGVLIAADGLDFDRVMVEAIRHAVTRAHNSPPENILLAASYTHWGPAIRLQMSFRVGAPNGWYMGYLEDKMVHEDLETGRLVFSRPRPQGKNSPRPWKPISRRAQGSDSAENWPAFWPPGRSAMESDDRRRSLDV